MRVAIYVVWFVAVLARVGSAISRPSTLLVRRIESASSRVSEVWTGIREGRPRGGSVCLNSSLRWDKWSPAGFRLLRLAAAG